MQNGNSDIFTDDTTLNPSASSGFQTFDFTSPRQIEEFISGEGSDTSPTSMPAAKNPLVRVVIAVAVVFAVMGFGGMVMLLSKDSSPKPATEDSLGEPSLTLSLDPEDSAQATESAEMDAMKAEIALLEQRLALSQMERGEQPRTTPVSVERPATPRPKAKPTSPPPRPAAKPAPRTQPVSAVRTRTPAAAPPPVVRRAPVPPPRAIAPAPSRAITHEEPPNPEAQWVEASNAGIMGVMPATEIVAPEPSQAEAPEIAAEPEYQLKGAVQVEFKQPTFEETTAQSIPGLYDAPRAGDIPMQAVAAEVITPITWLNANDQFLIELQDDLLDASGQAAILAGNSVIVQPMQVNESSGYAELAVVGVTNGDETIPLDYTKLSVKAGDGGPLIAERHGDVGGQIASNDLEMFAVGALGGIGQELIQPSSQTITNSAFGSSISAQDNDQNILGGILAGGIAQVADRMAARNDERLDALRDREQIFFLPAGMTVQVYISQDFQL